MKVKNLKIFIPFSRFNRVTSKALIHEELYESKGVDTIDFAAYLQKLTSYLFSSYAIKSENVRLELNLEEVHLEMDEFIWKWTLQFLLE